jgi:deazaflavin-dependent oxidoreductase (nitroreductase family)
VQQDARRGRLRVSLTTMGRTSGRPRHVSLYAFADGDGLVVVGSNGGAPEDPDWVANLRAEPRATLNAGEAEREVRAREVMGTERDRLWAVVTSAFPAYASFQRRARRVIPLFVLEAVESS